jgi:predicted AAA+ superfamily ATPase
MQPYYYGTPRGAEIDLVLEFASGAKWAIEIKRSSAPSVSKGFYSGCEDIKPDKRFVVYSGLDSFPMGADITAISLPDLMQTLLRQ